MTCVSGASLVPEPPARTIPFLETMVSRLRYALRLGPIGPCAFLQAINPKSPEGSSLIAANTRGDRPSPRIHFGCFGLEEHHLLPQEVRSQSKLESPRAVS